MKRFGLLLLCATTILLFTDTADAGWGCRRGGACSVSSGSSWGSAGGHSSMGSYGCYGGSSGYIVSYDTCGSWGSSSSFTPPDSGGSGGSGGFTPPDSNDSNLTPPDGMGRNHRTWLYGDHPTILVGSLNGMSGGNVHLVSHQGQKVTVPIQQLSVPDQKIVARQFGLATRQWTDSSEQFHRTAKFLRLDAQTVVLKAADATIRIPYGKLSEADRCVVGHLAGTPQALATVAAQPSAPVSAKLSEFAAR